MNGRLLEIGYGHGDFLDRAAARGLSVTGIAYSANAAKIAANKLASNGRIICGEITHLIGSSEQFDHIVFTDVLEHVRNPREFLHGVNSLLCKGGVAVVIVPSLDSVTARIMKNKWVEFKPEHLWYFSTNTLRRLLYSEGFGKIQSKLAKTHLPHQIK